MIVLSIVKILALWLHGVLKNESEMLFLCL